MAKKTTGGADRSVTYYLGVGIDPNVKRTVTEFRDTVLKAYADIAKGAERYQSTAEATFKKAAAAEGQARKQSGDAYVNLWMRLLHNRDQAEDAALLKRGAKWAREIDKEIAHEEKQRMAYWARESKRIDQHLAEMNRWESRAEQARIYGGGGSSTNPIGMPVGGGFGQRESKIASRFVGGVGMLAGGDATGMVSGAAMMMGPKGMIFAAAIQASTMLHDKFVELGKTVDLADRGLSTFERLAGQHAQGMSVAQAVAMRGSKNDANRRDALLAADRAQEAITAARSGGEMEIRALQARRGKTGVAADASENASRREDIEKALYTRSNIGGISYVTQKNMSDEKRAALLQEAIRLEKEAAEIGIRGKREQLAVSKQITQQLEQDKKTLEESAKAAIDRLKSAGERFGEMDVLTQQRTIAAHDRLAKGQTQMPGDVELIRGLGLDSALEQQGKRSRDLAEKAGFGGIAQAQQQQQRAAADAATAKDIQVNIDENLRIQVDLEASAEKLAEQLIEALVPRMRELQEAMMTELEKDKTKADNEKRVAMAR